MVADSRIRKKKIKAREFFQVIAEIQFESGYPYIMFEDTVNKANPIKGRINMSNLCSEITLPTGRDHLGNDRTAVCCLSSLNLETWDQWHSDERFIEDVMRFLDNVLEDFIRRAPPAMAAAVYSAKRERSVGLGLMGFHSFLQGQGVAFESAMAKSWNMRLFKHLRREADKASVLLFVNQASTTRANPTPQTSNRSIRLDMSKTNGNWLVAGMQQMA